MRNGLLACVLGALLLVSLSEAASGTGDAGHVATNSGSVALATSTLSSSKPVITKAVAALEVLASTGDAAASPSTTEAIGSFLQAVKGLWDEGSMLYRNSKGSAASVAATGAMLRVPRLLKELGYESEGAAPLVPEAAVVQALRRAQSDGSIAASGDSSAVSATAAFVLGLSNAEAFPQGADLEKLVAALTFLSRHRAEGDPAVAAPVLQALDAVVKSSVVPPVALVSVKSCLLSTEGGALVVLVTDAAGSPIDGARVAVDAASAVLGGKVLARSKSGAREFVYTATGADALTVGEHTLTVQGPHGASVTTQVQVRQKCVLEKLTWSSSAGKKHVPFTAQLEGVVLAKGDEVAASLVVECNGEAFKPAHGAITLTAPTGESVSYATVPDGGRLTATFSAAAVAKELPGAGVLHVTATVGDPLMTRPIRWDAGKVSVEAPGTRSERKQEALYAVKPEITHMHRAPHKQPPAVFPLIASVATCVPLLLWLSVLSKMGLNLSAFPKGSGGLAANLFLAALATALVLSVYFWVALNVVELAIPLLGVSVVLVIVGHRALSALASERMAKGTKSD